MAPLVLVIYTDQSSRLSSVKENIAAHLQRTIELAISSSSKANTEEWNQDLVFDNSLFIKNRNKLEKVNIGDVAYLEVEDRYSTLFTESGKKYVLRMSLGDVEARLPSNEFMRIHRKYTINLKKISSINTQDNLVLLGEIELPISKSHKEDLLQKLEWLQ